MKILLKEVSVADPRSPHNQSTKDILIDDGIIVRMEEGLNEADEVIGFENAVVSPGWVDTFAQFDDPGFEMKETIETGAAAAQAGGYTHVFILPNTNPPIDNKTMVEYVQQKSKNLPIHVLPLGAASKKVGGESLAEMYDMYDSGAVAFSDGSRPVQSTGLTVKALQYIKAFNGTMIQLPVDKSLATFGLVNEGVFSTRMGLPGIPSIGEELMVERDIKLARYADSKLHITGLSTARALKAVAEAKEEGLAVTCSVTPYHLYFCDEDLGAYDTTLKVDPPLRTKKDREALREGVHRGWIDCIATHHIPQDWDSKTCEFEYAKPGMIGLQSCYAVVQSIFPDLSTQQIAKLFSTNAREIFGLNKAVIQEGEPADLTIFQPWKTERLTRANNKSKSSNSPFFDIDLKGKVIGIFAKGKLNLNNY